MQKFFNYGEKQHKALDSDPFTVLEKLDGSLGIWFCYNKSWMMATRGSFISEQARVGQDMAYEYGLQTKCDPSKTYCFEILYPQNKLVVDYKGRRELVLLAIIDT